MIHVQFYDKMDDRLLKFAVIIAKDNISEYFVNTKLEIEKRIIWGNRCFRYNTYLCLFSIGFSTFLW
ncbi:hypothetical protein [Candidatus Stoquefichus massiliensis]|uniref:hypothetical protein n=1 Tax=Candidatus Stoquefichus massiliensis TaxID=1470350 RepID=UPI0005C8B082|nr:hypothetical protein [Candidatus Stoquefichus massiliensis]